MKKIAFISSIVFSVNALAIQVVTPVNKYGDLPSEQRLALAISGTRAGIDKCSNIRLLEDHHGGSGVTKSFIEVYQCKMQNGDTCNIAYAGGSLEMQCYK